ncbi:MAG: DMT family transporter [Pseudomonadota bacterium]
MSRAVGMRFAIFALLSACLGEALGFPLMKAFALCAGGVAPGVNSWFMTAFLLAGRFLLAALVLCCFERKLPNRKELEQGVWIGVFAGGGHLLQIDGLSWTDASTSAFLTQGYVVVLPLLAAVETRTRPERRVLWAVLVNLIGLAVLARFDPRTLSLGRGEAETLLAALLFAGQIFSISRPRYLHNEAGPVTVVMFLTVGLGSLPLAAATAGAQDLSHFAGSQPLWWLLGLLAVFSTLLPFVLMNRYQRHVSSSEAGVIYGAEPVFASMLALFLPAVLAKLAGIPYDNESVSLRLLVGAVLVTAAALLLRTRSGSDAGLEEVPDLSHAPE